MTEETKSDKFNSDLKLIIEKANVQIKANINKRFSEIIYIHIDLVSDLLKKLVKSYINKILKDIMNVELIKTDKILFQTSMYSRMYAIINIYYTSNKSKTTDINLITMYKDLIINYVVPKIKKYKLPIDNNIDLFLFILRLLLSVLCYTEESKNKDCNLIFYSLDIFKTAFINEEIDNIFSITNKMIVNMRETKDKKDYNKIKNIIRILIIMGKDLNLVYTINDYNLLEIDTENEFYINIFEKKYLCETQIYYNYEYTKIKYLLNVDNIKYFEKLNEFIDFECKMPLTDVTIIKSLDILLSIINDDIVLLINTALCENLENYLFSRTDDLSIIISLFNIIKGNKYMKENKKNIDTYNSILRKVINKYISTILEILGAKYLEEKSKFSGSNILYYYEMYKTAVSRISNIDINDTMIKLIKRDSIVQISNSEKLFDVKYMLNIHIDLLAKGQCGTVKIPENIIEDNIKFIFNNYFNYCIDKDIFMENYMVLLAKRLLAEKYISFDIEKTIISCIKAILSNTRKIEDLLNNFIFSKENIILMPAYKANIQIFQEQKWPALHSFNDIKYPPQLHDIIKNIKTQYKSSHTKNIDIINSLGTIKLSLVIKTKYIITCHLLQAAVLIYLNSEDKYTIRELMETMNIDIGNMSNILGAMLFSNIKILRKIPHNNKINENDIIEINPDFTSKIISVKIPIPIIEFKYKIEMAISSNRKFQIQAHIVRCMKARKEMPHGDLINEIKKQITDFRPDDRSIKIEIEYLISSLYLERLIDMETGTLKTSYKYIP